MAASIASSNRDEALDKVYEEIEKDLIVSFNLHNSFLDIPNRIGDFIFITFFLATPAVHGSSLAGAEPGPQQQPKLLCENARSLARCTTRELQVLLHF